MMLFKARFQSAQNFDGMLNRRLINIHLLKTAGEGGLLLKNTAILLIGCSPDAAQFTIGQCRLKQV